jgi:hypothetical protein
MWRRDVRTDRPGSDRLECRAPFILRLLGALAVRQAHRIDLAVATGWCGGPVVDHGRHVLDSGAATALVKPLRLQNICLPISRGRVSPIAAVDTHFGIDIFSRSCITRPEGPRAGVGHAGRFGSQS